MVRIARTGNGEGESENRTPTRIVVNRDLAPVLAHNPLANGQTQPGAVGLAEGDKGLEDVGQHLRRNPGPVVRHIGIHHVPIGPETHPDSPVGAIGQGVERVLQQVGEDPE